MEENICKTYLFRELILRIYEELLELSNRKTAQVKLSNGSVDIFPKKTCKWPKVST
jgi:hypothetical protein